MLEEYEEEPEPFEQPEERPMFLSDLFGMAAEVEAAQMLAEGEGQGAVHAQGTGKQQQGRAAAYMCETKCT